jgi:hypothetical protein
MPLPPSSKPSASVIAAGIFAVAGSLLTILILSLGLVSFVMVGSRANAQMPAWVTTAMEAMLALFVAVAIFGVVTGVGLLRLRNWARISALVWAGVSAPFSAFGVLLIVLTPFPTPPNVPAGLIAAMRWGFAIFYALPLLIGVWWLVLFNGAAMKRQFSGQDISADSGIPQKPRCPTPIAVLAWFYIVSVLTSVPFLFLLPFPMPMFMFGHLISGFAGRVILGLNCLLFPVAGIGLLKLKSWSYPLTIGIHLLWFASGIVTILSPNYKVAIASVILQMHDAMHLPNTVVQPPGFGQSTTWTVVLILVLYGAVLGMLVYYRERFLKAAAASNA